MAAKALLTRFVSTCMIWSRSTSADRVLDARARPSISTPSGCARPRRPRCDQLGEVDPVVHHLVLPGEVEQAGDDLLAAVGLLGDHRQVARVLGLAGQLLLQEVRVHQHDAERVVHLVGDAGGQLAHAGQLLGLHQRLLRVGQLLVRARQLAAPCRAAARWCAAGTSRARPGRGRWRSRARGRSRSRRRRSSARRSGRACPFGEELAAVARARAPGRRMSFGGVVARRGRRRANSAIARLPRRQVARGDALAHVLADARAAAEVGEVASSCPGP